MAGTAVREQLVPMTADDGRVGHDRLCRGLAILGLTATRVFLLELGSDVP